MVNRSLSLRTYLILFSILCLLSCAFEIIRFAGGGIYFWWQAGAATYLLQHSDLQQTHLIGSSAGAISASLLLAKADFEEAAKLAIRQVDELKIWDNPIGLAGVWGPLLQEFLETLILPANITASDLRRIHIAATPRLIFRGTTYLHSFDSKEELISAVLTSTHIPFFMNGKPWRSFKGKKYIDGSFWPFLLRTKPTLPESILDLSKEDRRVGILNMRSDDFYQEDYVSTRKVSLKVNQQRQQKQSAKLKLLDVDFQQDDKLLQTMKGVAFVKLIRPETLYNMMELGYNFMKTGKYESNSLSL